MKLAIVGGGNMGGAFARACIEKEICAPNDLLIVEPVDLRRAELANLLGCQVEPAIGKHIANYAVVILAVKPAELNSAGKALQAQLSAKQLVISILAGCTVQSVSRALGGHTNVIRCMPNTPVQLGLGMSVYFAAPEVAKAGVKIVQEICEATGASFAVSDEKLIDAATAISASGPAYVYYFIEHFIKAAQGLGFSPDEAELLVGQTLTGSLGLWSASGESPQTLRERVTSKGGTTEAALTVFEARKIGDALVEGIERADARCRELQKETKQ